MTHRRQRAYLAPFTITTSRQSTRDLEVPVENRIGEEGKAFSYILSEMNAERILLASESVGDALFFIDRCTKYAGLRPADRSESRHPVPDRRSVHPYTGSDHGSGPRRRALRRGGALSRRGQHEQVPGVGCSLGDCTVVDELHHATDYDLYPAGRNIRVGNRNGYSPFFQTQETFKTPGRASGLG